MIQKFKVSGPHALVKSKPLSNLLGQNFTDGPGIALSSHQLKHFLSVLFILFCWKYKVHSSLYSVSFQIWPHVLNWIMCLFGQVPCHLSLCIQHTRVFFSFLLNFFCHSTWHTGSLLLNQGSNLCSPQQKHGVLITGPPGKFQQSVWNCVGTK